MKQKLLLLIPVMFLLIPLAFATYGEDAEFGDNYSTTASDYIAFDRFNRADGSDIGNLETGQAWQEEGQGNEVISDGMLYIQSGEGVDSRPKFAQSLEAEYTDIFTVDIIMFHPSGTSASHGMKLRRADGFDLSQVMTIWVGGAGDRLRYTDESGGGDHDTTPSFNWVTVTDTTILVRLVVDTSETVNMTIFNFSVTDGIITLDTLGILEDVSSGYADDFGFPVIVGDRRNDLWVTEIAIYNGTTRPAYIPPPDTVSPTIDSIAINSPATDLDIAQVNVTTSDTGDGVATIWLMNNATGWKNISSVNYTVPVASVKWSWNYTATAGTIQHRFMSIDGNGNSIESDLMSITGDTPIAHYDCDESSGTTLNNGVDANYDGTASSASLWSASNSKLGTGNCYFDDTYFVTGMNYGVQTEWTFAAWVWADTDYTTEWNAIFNYEGGYGGIMSANYDDVQPITSAGSSAPITINPPFTQGWVHLIVTETSGVVTAYTNNVAGDSPISNYFALPNGNMQIAGYYTGPGEYPFDGRFDDIRIYDEVIDADTRAFIYNDGDGTQDSADSSVNLLYTAEVGATDTEPASMLLINLTSECSVQPCLGQVIYRNGTREIGKLNGTVRTNDTTPTIRAITNRTATCQLLDHNKDLNYSDGIEYNAGSECSTTGALNHICTLTNDNATRTGLHNFSIGCKDTSDDENENRTSTSGKFTINITDPVPPQVSIENISAFFVKEINNSIVYGFNSTDNFDSVYTLESFINDSAETSDTSYANGTAIIASFSRNVGVYNFSVRATDTFNNINETYLVFEVQNDSIAPIVKINDTGTFFFRDLNSSFDIGFNATDNLNATFNLTSMINGSFQSSDAAYANGTTIVHTVDQTEGFYNFTVIAIDPYNNKENATIFFEIGVDDVKPIIGFNVTETFYVKDINNTFSIGFNATDNFNQTFTLQAFINGSAEFSDTNYINNTVINYNVTNGTGFYNFSVVAEDRYNNIANHTLYFEIRNDSSPPNVTLDIPANNSLFKVGINTTDIKFNGTCDDNFNQTYTAQGYIDEVLQLTNTTYRNGTEFNFSKTITDLGSHTWSINCTDSYGNFNSEGRSFIVEQEETADLFFDLFNDTKYEFRSIANISANCTEANGLSCLIEIDLNAPGFGFNFSANDNFTSFLFNITTLRIVNFSDGYRVSNGPGQVILSASDTINVTSDNKTIMQSVKLNITSSGTTTNLNITYEDKSITFKGDLKRIYLTDDEFIHDGINKIAVNLSHITAGSSFIFYNLSDINPINMIFRLTGFDLDEGNEFSYIEDFNGTDGSGFNETLSFHADAPLGIWDDMVSNVTDRWQIGECTASTSELRYLTDGHGTNIGLGFGVGEGESAACDLIYEDEAVDFRDTSKAELDLDLHISASRDINSDCSASASWTLYATDGTSSIALDTESVTRGANPGGTTSLIVNRNYTFERTSSDFTIFKVIENGSSLGNKDLSSLNFDEQIKFKFGMGASGGTNGPGTCSASSNTKIYQVKWGGGWLNRSTNNGTYKSIGNLTSNVLVVTDTNISKATLTWEAYEPSGTGVAGYISNACISSTFEPVTSGLIHTFDTVGNKPCVRFVLSSSINQTSPIVKKYTFDITPTSIANITVDLGNDGIDDFTHTGVLNSSTGSVFVNLTPTGNQLNTLKISSETSGLLQVDQFKVNSTINPITLNHVTLDDCSNCVFNFTFSGNSITVNALEWDFFGSHNYTATARFGTIEQKFNLPVYYSNFNISIPSGYDWWDLFPSSKDAKNVTPYTQTDSTPIWNLTNEAYDEDINIYVKTNESLNLCYNITFSNSSNQSNYVSDINFELNKSYQLIAANISVNLDAFPNKGIWNWVNLDNCSNRFEIPWFYYAAMCSDCYFTNGTQLDRFNIIET